MQLAIILILSIGGPALYFVAGLACGKIAYRRTCTQCGCRGRSCGTSEDHQVFCVGAGILWPLYLLGRLATYIANYAENTDSRKEARHQKELGQIRHAAEIAEAKKQAIHEAQVNDKRRETEAEAAMQDLLLEQSGRRAAERAVHLAESS